MAARLQNGEGAQVAARPGRVDRLDEGSDGLRHRPQLSPARCPCFGPRRASAAGAQQPRCAHALTLSGEAPTYAGLPHPAKPPATPPERAEDEKAQAGGRRRSPRRRRHTPQAHTATSKAAPDRRAASPRSPTPPPPPPTSPPSASWPALPTRTSLGPETNIPAWGRE